MIYPLPAHNLYGNDPILLDFPDLWDVHICSYKGEKAPALTQEQIAEKIKNPMGTGRIAKDAKGCKNAVIIFDDITRPTPVGPIAEAVIAELEEAGIPRHKIWFIAAVGGHRAMYREDFVRKLGEELVQEFRIYSHNPFFNNILLGITSFGVPIELNADVVFADYKIGIGAAFAHVATGVGGGAKIILPGIASLESIRRFHLQPRGRWDITAAARANTIEAADMLGLNFKIDALLNGKGEIANIYAGHYARIIDDNIGDIKDFFSVKPAGMADLVIANNYFKPAETSLATMFTGVFESVKDGGDIVVSSHTPQGNAQHYLFGKWGECGIGGVMYTGKKPVPPNINHYIAFSIYLDKGTGAGWHHDQDLLYWAGQWSEVLDIVGKGEKKVVVYPYASDGYFVV